MVKGTKKSNPAKKATKKKSKPAFDAPQADKFEDVSTEDEEAPAEGWPFDDADHNIDPPYSPPQPNYDDSYHSDRSE